MIKFRYFNNDKEHAPIYMTGSSAGADLRARKEITLNPNERAKIPTGVFIDGVSWSEVPTGTVPELQIRARSGLALKHGLTLVNGIGTVDADFPDEICALMINLGEKPYKIQKGERVAQMVLNFVFKIKGLDIGGERIGGFGSTDNSNN